MKSIVIDTCIMRLYDNPIDPVYKDFFNWITHDGTLIISQGLLVEYLRTGNKNISLLLDKLNKNNEKKRLIKIDSKDLKKFKDDKNFNYTCNTEDQMHAKLVFLSNRKKLVSQDGKLIIDINNFHKVGGIKPEAVKRPSKEFYE